MNRRRFAVVSLLVVLLVAAGAARLAFQKTASAMTAAANAFLESLSPELRSQARMAFDDPARFDWHYIPKDKRKGLQIKNMSPDSRKQALALLQTGLSEIGYHKATTIMSLEAILHELEKTRDNAPIRDPERYYFTIFGRPESSGKWGWSVEGHHLSLNFSVSDGRLVSSTPTFFGSNPATVGADYGAGPKKGTRVLVKEETLAFDLLRSLTPEQRKVAVIAEKAPDDVGGAGQARAKVGEPAGIAADKLTAEQLKTLQSLLETYAGNVFHELGDARLEEIKLAGIEKVHFAWAGADKPGIGHYYRVQGPTFLIELVNVQPDAAGNPANHIHSVWRSLKGDFGLDQ
jgi:hypothetical protein